MQDIRVHPGTMEMGLTMTTWRAETSAHTTISLLPLSIPEYKVKQNEARTPHMAEIPTCRAATSRACSEGTWSWPPPGRCPPASRAPSTTSTPAAPAGDPCTAPPWKFRQRKFGKFLRVCPPPFMLRRRARPTTTGILLVFHPPNQQPALFPAPSSCKMATTAAIPGARRAG